MLIIYSYIYYSFMYMHKIDLIVRVICYVNDMNLFMCTNPYVYALCVWELWAIFSSELLLAFGWHVSHGARWMLATEVNHHEMTLSPQQNL